jgi:hypothetical protein
VNTFYSAKDVGTSANFRVSITPSQASISNGGYIYIDFGQLGPVPNTLLCSTYSECRTYSTVPPYYIVVAKTSSTISGSKSLPSTTATSMSAISHIYVNPILTNTYFFIIFIIITRIKFAIYQITTGHTFVEGTNTITFSNI